MNIPVVIKRKKGEKDVVAWMPYEEYMKQQFIGKVLQHKFFVKALWRKEMDKEDIFNYAKRVQQEDKFPVEYIQFFNPDVNN